jgi:5-aminolevulinate synthase
MVGVSIGFIFTSSIPPAVAAGAAASVRYLKTSQVERQKHQARAAQLKQMMRDANLPLIESPSHIVPVMIGDPRLCKAASDMLMSKHKIYVQPINYPTVPRGTEVSCIPFIFSYLHLHRYHTN